MNLPAMHIWLKYEGASAAQSSITASKDQIIIADKTLKTLIPKKLIYSQFSNIYWYLNAPNISYTLLTIFLYTFINAFHK